MHFARGVRIGLATAALGSAAVAGGVLAAGGSASAPPAPDGPSGTLVLIEKETQARSEDVGRAGESLGDWDVFSGQLRKDGELVGTSGGQCLFVHIHRKDGEITAISFQCTATLRLTGGQVTLQGMNKFGPAGGIFRGAITGGTGDYESAGGWFEVETLSESRSRITLHFS
jgi:hypothetical protein